jgi:RecG wedge domain
MTASPARHHQSAGIGALQSSISIADGIGPKRAAALHERNIDTFYDALLHLPYRYIDLRQRNSVANLRPEMDAVIEGRLEGLNLRPRRYGNFRSASSARLVDSTNRRIKVVWFNLPSYTQFPVGEPVLLCGKVTVGNDGALQLTHPEVHRLTGGEVPPIRPVTACRKRCRNGRFSRQCPRGWPNLEAAVPTRRLVRCRENSVVRAAPCQSPTRCGTSIGHRWTRVSSSSRARIRQRIRHSPWTKCSPFSWPFAVIAHVRGGGQAQ